MKLFSVPKIGIFCDEVKHTSEKRKGRGEVKVMCLSLRIQPMTSQIATAIDPLVRSALFKLSGNGDPLAHIKSTEFHFPFERQIFTIFASPDTVKPSLVFDQVRVVSVKARTERGIDGYAAVIKAQFEQTPEQLVYAEEWRGTQRFISTEEAEPMLEDVEPDAETDEDDDPQPKLPEPMFEDPRDNELVGVGAKSKPERTQRKTISHARGKKAKRR